MSSAPTRARLRCSSSSARLWVRAGSRSKTVSCLLRTFVFPFSLLDFFRQLSELRPDQSLLSFHLFLFPLLAFFVFRFSSSPPAFLLQSSWCKLEVSVADPKNVRPLTDSDGIKEMPPLTIMSLSARTVVNHKENNREVVCVAARAWENCEQLLLVCPSSCGRRRFVGCEDKLTMAYVRDGRFDRQPVASRTSPKLDPHRCSPVR
jgi:hypothetical protein